MSQLDDDDRREWDRAWSSMPHRRIKSWNQDVIRIVIGQEWPIEQLVALTISADPVDFADKQLRTTTICPICGTVADSTGRLAASIHPVFDFGGLGQKSPVMFGVWAHPQCFEDCPIIEQPTPIPW
jgi:hypothetical protein